MLIHKLIIAGLSLSISTPLVASTYQVGSANTNLVMDQLKKDILDNSRLIGSEKNMFTITKNIETKTVLWPKSWKRIQ
ncbi:hypothetical protein SCLARK_00416 [Spiroplasma clarkii]|uniref:hypothetical protein n=1 Tax=Spiroplasma clarkii TaxID=2139 RepID=UPI000B562EF7|nr:hypothetical protein [Spiroplasma clarkii]ARU91138.1 hypothetical protein SCLARK_00416 [Spiroplasma clarkii]